MNPGGNKSNIRVVFPEKVGNPGTVNLIFTDPMGNSLLVQKFQKLRGGIFYISINMDIPDVARKPEQQDHTEKEPGCKALAFLDSEQQKRQTSFFQNMDTDSGLSMYGKEFSEIIYGDASCYVFF